MMNKIVVLTLMAFFGAVSAQSQKNDSTPSAVPQVENLAETMKKADNAADKPQESEKAQADSSGGDSSVITLKISTDPTEAALKIGERSYGLTPVEITDLDTGSYVIELSKSGHFRRRVTIQLDSAGADLHFDLLRPALLVITSDPEGAELNIDGKAVGTAPFRDDKMRPGDYRIGAAIDGYKQVEIPVSLKSGSSDTLNIILEPVENQLTPFSENQTNPVEKADKRAHRRAGFIALTFFIFIAALIGVEKTSY
ncbi:MAG: PEGA domain-containing protein [Chitinispirillales bacterium]|jgi:hypothetical protein|nr:PEGA domain-containing protein [Chitinispirillales bacterium]